ncbi:MAG TPA: hypothetical protein VEW67_04130 [Thermoleophilaceae bacterium]|nr:hypothetical protein [Thermoleophilaceae bacterium]
MSLCWLKLYDHEYLHALAIACASTADGWATASQAFDELAKRNPRAATVIAPVASIASKFRWMVRKGWVEKLGPSPNRYRVTRDGIAERDGLEPAQRRASVGASA